MRSFISVAGLCSVVVTAACIVLLSVKKAPRAKVDSEIELTASFVAVHLGC
jgi:hypothetical protein